MLSYATIGMILSAPRWPKSARTHAELEVLLVGVSRNVPGVAGTPSDR